MKKRTKKHFVVCAKNEDYRASLEIRKIYLAIPDKKALEHNLIRIIDESGEEYLYPGEYFISIELPHETEEALLMAG